MTDKKLLVRLPEELHKVLKVYCAEKEISIQSFVIHAIRDELVSNKTWDKHSVESE